MSQTDTADSLQNILDGARRLVEDFTFPTVRDWKESHPNGKVVGYFPVYAPVEIIHAAGMLPLGLLGAGSYVPVQEADSYFPSFVCSIPRTTTELLLTGRLSFLEGMLFTPICDVARTLAAIWDRNFPQVACELLSVTQNLAGSGAIEFMHGEYQQLQRFLAELSGVSPASQEALHHSLQLYNQQRRLLRRLYNIRRETPWLVSAAEAYVLARVGTVLPVEEHNALLERVLSLVPKRDARQLDKVRVIFEGAFCEQPPLEFIEAMEEVCYVVDDDFLHGQRWFSQDVPEEGDPLLTLATSYRDLMVYSSIQNHAKLPKGPEFMKKFRNAQAQAAILSPAKFCEPGLEDQVMFANYLKRDGFRALCLELEEKLTSFEDTRIQMETFAESLLFYA